MRVKMKLPGGVVKDVRNYCGMSEKICEITGLSPVDANSIIYAHDTAIANIISNISIEMLEECDYRLSVFGGYLYVKLRRGQKMPCILTENGEPLQTVKTKRILFKAAEIVKIPLRGKHKDLISKEIDESAEYLFQNHLVDIVKVSINKDSYITDRNLQFIINKHVIGLYSCCTVHAAKIYLSKHYPDFFYIKPTKRSPNTFFIRNPIPEAYLISYLRKDIEAFLKKGVRLTILHLENNGFKGGYIKSIVSDFFQENKHET